MEYFVIKSSENDSLLTGTLNKSSSSSVVSLATTLSNSSGGSSLLDDDNNTNSTSSTPSTSLVSVNSHNSFAEGFHDNVRMSLLTTTDIINDITTSLSSSSSSSSVSTTGTGNFVCSSSAPHSVPNMNNSSSGTNDNNNTSLRVSFADTVDRITVPNTTETNDTISSASSTVLSHEFATHTSTNSSSSGSLVGNSNGSTGNNISVLQSGRNNSSTSVDGSKYRRLHCRDVTSFTTGSVLGEGMYGVVTQATDPLTNKKVVIKKIKFERDNEGFPVTALREIQALQILRHPNVINLQEVVTSKPSDHNRMLGDVFMVFEYMDGDALGLVQYPELVRTHSQIKCYMKQLLEGLAYLHACNIIHRDLKPGNLMLNRNHQLKIGDFGLCKRWKVGLPMTGQVVTPWYRAPELFLGDTNAGPPVDVWSVGIIFIEFITGSPPFINDDNIIQDIWAICGLPTETSWPGVTKLPAWPNARPRKPFTPNIKGKYGRHLSANGIDLLTKLLTLNPAERITAADALNHPYFTEGSGTPDAQSFPPIAIERFHCAEVTTIRKNLSRHRNIVTTVAKQDDETVVPAVPTANNTNTGTLSSTGTGSGNANPSSQPAKRRRTNSIAETNGSTVRVPSSEAVPATEPSTETTNATTVTSTITSTSSSTNTVTYSTANGLAIPRTIGSVLPRPPMTISGNGLLPRPGGIPGGRGLPIMARPVQLLARPVSLSSGTTATVTAVSSISSVPGSVSVTNQGRSTNGAINVTATTNPTGATHTNSMSPEIDSSSLFLP